LALGVLQPRDAATTHGQPMGAIMGNPWAGRLARALSGSNVTTTNQLQRV